MSDYTGGDIHHGYVYNECSAAADESDNEHDTLPVN